MGWMPGRSSGALSRRQQEQRALGLKLLEVPRLRFCVALVGVTHSTELYCFRGQTWAGRGPWLPPHHWEQMCPPPGPGCWGRGQAGPRRSHPVRWGAGGTLLSPLGQQTQWSSKGGGRE